MAVRGKAMVPSTASRVLIRVNKGAAGELSGLLYSPYLEKSIPFDDVLDFANRLDELFDQMSFPQAGTQYRSFAAAKKEKAGREKQEATPAEAKVPNGDEADCFIVHVRFRQNATWQGTVQWAAGNGEQLRFRSTLELFKIIDGALSSGRAGAAEFGALPGE